MTTGTHIAVVGLLVLGLVAPAPAESVSALLERAIHQEETVGDLDAAMAIYREIVKAAKADRKFIAQAQYRLGVCYLKKKQHRQAAATMDELIRSYGEQKELVAKARKCLTAARGRMSGEELAKLVEDAVTIVSTCSESDPRAREAMASLKGLSGDRVVKALRKHLVAEKNTMRRSAIYIVWKGGFPDVSAAVPVLLKLCAHKEDFTRGMAALALGDNKVAASFQPLCAMALKDTSGYARRCAAYALGLLGRVEAEAVLEKARKDTDAMVRNNAEAALTLLSLARGKALRAPKVVRSTPANFADNVAPGMKSLSVTFDQPMRDRCWSWVQRSAESFPKMAGKPSYDKALRTCTLPVELAPGKVYWIGINSPPYTAFQSAKRTRAQQHVLLFATSTADGKPTPIRGDLLARAKAILAGAGEPAPNVVATSPRTLADDVAPSLDRITVTFDRKMADESWSWVKRSDETYAKTTGRPSYDKAQRTCTLPVKLEPGKVYWVQINSEKHKFFQTPARKPAVPYVILFAARGTDGKPTPIPAGLRAEAEAINAAAAKAKRTLTGRRVDKPLSKALAAEGWRLWNRRKLADAEAKFHQAVRSDPDNAHAWNGLGWAQQNQSKLADAKESFGKCLALDARHAGALNGLGWIAKIEKRTDEALAYWKKAVEALPSAVAALNGLTSTYMELKRYDEAVRYYEMWLKAEPDNAAAKAGLSKAKAARR